MNPRRWLELWCNIHMHHQPNPHSVWGFPVRNHGATSKLFHCVLKNTPLHTYVWATRMQWLSSGTSYLHDYWRTSPSPGPHGRPSLWPTTRERLYDPSGLFLVCFTIHLGEIYASLAHRLKMCVCGGVLLCTLLGEPQLRGVCIHSLGFPSCRHEGGC